MFDLERVVCPSTDDVPARSTNLGLKTNFVARS